MQMYSDISARNSVEITHQYMHGITQPKGDFQKGIIGLKSPDHRWL